MPVVEPQPPRPSRGAIAGIIAAAVFAVAIAAAAVIVLLRVTLRKRRVDSGKGGSKRDLNWPGALRSYADLDFQTGPDGRPVVLGKGAFGTVSEGHLMSCRMPCNASANAYQHSKELLPAGKFGCSTHVSAVYMTLVVLYLQALLKLCSVQRLENIETRHMLQVYKARWLGQLVAVKMIRNEGEAQEKEFLKEAALLEGVSPSQCHFIRKTTTT